MRPRAGPCVAATVLALLLLEAVTGAGVLWGQPSVFFEPGQKMVVPEEQFELSFRVGECDDLVASFQLYMSFDHTMVELVEATEGSLYTESGLMTWFVAEEEEPGFWHFFDTVFGAGTHVIPPGELLHLRFRALPDACGHTQAYIDTIRMTDEVRDPLPVGGFEHADIFVAGTSAPESAAGSGLGPASPNPFVNETEIRFSIPAHAGALEVRIHDVAGRLVRRLDVAAGLSSGELTWDGRSDAGADVAPGVYLVAIVGLDRGPRTKVLKLR